MHHALLQALATVPETETCSYPSIQLPTGGERERLRQCVAGLRDAYQPESVYHRWAERAYEVITSANQTIPVNLCLGRSEPPSGGSVDVELRGLLDRFHLAPGVVSQEDLYDYLGGRVSAYADHSGSEKLAVLPRSLNIGEYLDLTDGTRSSPRGHLLRTVGHCGRPPN